MQRSIAAAALGRCMIWIHTSCAMLAFCAMLASGPARSDTYPDHVVRLIAAFPAGGTSDLLARLIADRLSKSLGQTFVVENRVGANGIVGTEYVAKQRPDGYTIMLVPSGQAINVSLYSKLPFDPEKSFEPIILVGTVPMAVLVRPSLPVKSIAELIDLARKQPGQITFGSGGVGASNHLAIELFSSMAHIKMMHVPYQGDTPELNDLLGGQIDMGFLNTPAAIPFIKSGKLRVIAVTSAERVATLPDVPTIAESGVPGYDAGSWHAMFAPAGTPKEIIGLLNARLQEILAAPEMRTRLTDLGINVAGGTPEQCATFLHKEIAKWAEVIRVAGVHL